MNTMVIMGTMLKDRQTMPTVTTLAKLNIDFPANDDDLQAGPIDERKLHASA